MFDSLRDWSTPLKNVFLPQFCRQCDTRLLTEENGYFCPTCWESSRRIDRPFCTICGRPHKGAVGFGTTSNFPCSDCRDTNERSRHCDAIFGAAVYDDAIAEAVKLFKFNDKRRLAGPLADLMIEFATREIECDRYAFLVPVPLYRVRERERGFNQSRELARNLAAAFPTAAVDESLTRVRPTRVQSRIKDEKERRANVKNAFEVSEDHPYRGRTVLLVDDVVTTGGTVNECARVLKKADASKVDVFAAALSVGKLV
jgi:ComF family protein